MAHPYCFLRKGIADHARCGRLASAGYPTQSMTRPSRSLHNTQPRTSHVPFSIIAQYIRHTKRCISLASLWLSGVRFWAVPPHFLARARVRQFRKKPSLLHLPSQTIESKRFRGEGFTPFLPSPLPSPLSMTSHGTTLPCAACMKNG